MSRLIDADALKADYGMKDDCADCEKEAVGSIRSCQYDTVYTKMDFCGWIDSMPTIEPETEEEAYERGYTAGQMAQRKKGHWTGENACEFCGFQPWFERDIHTLSYCPNCGADMRGR